MPFKLPLILSIVAVVFKGRADLIAENMAVPRHYLARPGIFEHFPVICDEVMIRRMLFKRPLVLSIIAAVFKDRADLVAENIAVPRHY